MRVLIVILILAIVAYGIYRNLKVENGTTDSPGIAGGVNENKHEYNGEDKEPRPDDEEHDEDGTHE